MRRNRNQIQRNQQLSDEEMQRTQVLNLHDFKETARIEKLSSKKPAIIIAMIGLLSISIGIAFPAVQSMSARKEADVKKREIEKRKQLEDESKSLEEKLVCHWENLNKSNGTDEIIDVTLHFKDDKLYSSKKDYRLTRSVTVTEDPGELSSYLNALQSFLIQKNGYKVYVQTIENGSITTTEIDYTSLDITQIPQQHLENYRFNVLNKENASKEEVITNMATAGYTCK